MSPVPPMYPVLTNESYFEIYNHKLIGKGFIKENMENKDKVAVIESSLALKLFFNTNAVGKTITLMMKFTQFAVS